MGCECADPEPNTSWISRRRGGGPLNSACASSISCGRFVAGVLDDVVLEPFTGRLQAVAYRYYTPGALRSLVPRGHLRLLAAESTRHSDGRTAPSATAGPFLTLHGCLQACTTCGSTGPRSPQAGCCAA